MNITLTLKNEQGGVLLENCQENAVQLVYDQIYAEGDSITLSVSEPHCFLMIQLDDVLSPSFVYMKEKDYSLVIPFEEKRFSYNPKSFAGDLHLLKARLATKEEIASYKNLAMNDHDSHANASCFPHAYANIETRGESVFAARNAINGNTENHGHGKWPYESWGINRDPQAEFSLDFGREVCVDKIVLVCRADFPHDNYWKKATIDFSDGSSMILEMECSDKGHVFAIDNKVITGLKLHSLIQDETNLSPFPALVQIEVYGIEGRKN